MSAWRPLQPEEPHKTYGEFESAARLDKDAPDAAGVAAADNALEALRARHLAFKRPEKCESCSLEELRLNILTAVTGETELAEYYREAFATSGAKRGTAPAASTNNQVVGLSPALRRVAVMQLELISRAYYVLQLNLFANAPENRGWMILFRRWGSSRLFNAAFDELEQTLSPDVAAFYRLYLRDLPPLASASGHVPIHHPWLRPKDEAGRRSPGLYMDSGRMHTSEDRSGEGSDRQDQTFEQPLPRAEETPPPNPNE